MKMGAWGNLRWATGRAPVWSMWAWVTTMASMSPAWSRSGKRSRPDILMPASTRMVPAEQSIWQQDAPTSSTPPRKVSFMHLTM